MLFDVSCNALYGACELVRREHVSMKSAPAAMELTVELQEGDFGIEALKPNLELPVGILKHHGDAAQALIPQHPAFARGRHARITVLNKRKPQWYEERKASLRVSRARNHLEDMASR